MKQQHGPVAVARQYINIESQPLSKFHYNQPPTQLNRTRSKESDHDSTWLGLGAQDMTSASWRTTIRGTFSQQFSSPTCNELTPIRYVRPRTIKFYVGKTARSFSIHENLLVPRGQWCQEKLKQLREKKRSDLITIDSVDPHIFDIYVDLLYVSCPAAIEWLSGRIMTIFTEKQPCCQVQR